jgi:hypothetical protein
MFLCFSLLGVSLSSDFIAGFCGETEDDHLQTLSLIRTVKYNFAFCFPYSMRQVSEIIICGVERVPNVLRLFSTLTGAVKSLRGYNDEL